MYNIPNLSEARRAIKALLPHLPVPRVADWIASTSPSLSAYDCPAPAGGLPILEFPTALLSELRLYDASSLPLHWRPVHNHLLLRRAREKQYQGLHTPCVLAESRSYSIPIGLDHCDPTVAGLLLSAVCPHPGEMRDNLFRAVVRKPIGAYIAARGMLLEEEHRLVLAAIAQDSQLAAALYHRDRLAADDLPKRLFPAHDFWAATVLLNDSNAGAWLAKVVASAGSDPVAAVTALVLQPSANESLQSQWIELIQASESRFAYEAARWAQHTWDQDHIGTLHDTLRGKATADLGRFYCLWHRDVQSADAARALENAASDVLWSAELVHGVGQYDHILGRRCKQRLKDTPEDAEATLTLLWLDQRRTASLLHCCKSQTPK